MGLLVEESQFSLTCLLHQPRSVSSSFLLWMLTNNGNKKLRHFDLASD